jgi:hypothetical protein
MRVGIITLHRAHNCGAMLQALALQVTLRRMGHSPCMVEANAIGEGRRWPNVPLTSWKGWLVWAMQWFFSLGIRQRKIKSFREFLRHLSLSEKYPHASAITASEYDRFIVGSDQVWNLDLVRDANLFLLEFCSESSKKMAYAASFGLETLPLAWKARFTTALPSFAHITVREEQAVRIVNELTGRTPAVVLDPSLLLCAEDYRTYESTRIVGQPYVCVYSIGAAATYMRELGRQVAAARGIKLVFVDATSFGDWRRSLRDYQIVSPDRFLGFIRHAECVISTSYHATIFSIHYKRPFLTVLPDGSRVTSRPKSLLIRLGLADHLIDEGTTLDDPNARMAADFTRVHQVLHDLRAKSLAHLQSLVE